MTEDEAAALTGLIYDAAFDEQLWVPVMNRMADMVGGGATIFMRKNFATGQGQGLFGRITEAQFTDYFGRFARANPLAAAVAELPAGSFLIDWQVMQKTDLVRSAYYNEFLLRRDIHGVLGLMVWRDGPEAAIINLARPPGSGEFLPEHAERLTPFMPHLRRAVGLARRLPAWPLQADGLDRVVAFWRAAVLVLDAAGRVLYANPAAERMLTQQDGLALRHGALGAADPAAARRLAALIRMAAAANTPRGGVLAVPRPSGRRPYAVQVTPCRPERSVLFPAPARVVLSIAELDAAGAPDPAMLREVFGLSRAQAAVATLLAEGRELRQIAALLAISLYTVRRHLADAMDKTNTTSQVQLVRLLARLPDVEPPPEAGTLRH